MSHLNYFEPYQSKTETHEDHLTRAFLVVLRYSPSALLMFLEYVKKALTAIAEKKQVKNISVFSKLDLNDVVFKTQVRTLKDLVGDTVVSVLITDERLNIEKEVKPSQRGACYDGVISFGKDLTLVIENKPKSYNVWEEQLSPSLRDCTEEVTVIKVAPTLEWKETISQLNSLSSRESIKGAEKLIISDFLEFVDKNFSSLNPYTSFLVCKDDEYLLRRRCVNVLEELFPGKVEYHHGWQKDSARIEEGAVREIALSPYNVGKGKEWKIVLEFYPADTMSQARDLYTGLNVDRLLELKDKGWDIQPHMHFSFRAKGLFWSEVRLPIKEYLMYWKKGIDGLSQVKRKDFNKVFDELKEDKLISSGDRIKLQKMFLKTKHQKLNICPSIQMWYEWSKLLAIDLDKKGKFNDAVKAKIEESFAVLK